jgi:transcriptional regulator with XRE-family HTH domain
MRMAHKLERLDEALLKEAREKAGRKIKDRRRAERLSQEKLSALLRVSQPTFSRIEKGEHDPTLSELLIIIHALDIQSIEDLFGDFPSRSLTASSQPPGG